MELASISMFNIQVISTILLADLVTAKVCNHNQHTVAARVPHTPARGKRWTRYGNKVWTEPVKIGFYNYTDVFSRRDQDAILKECTDMWTIPGYLEFIIINPTEENRAHITLSYQYISDLERNNGKWETLAYSYAPQPQSPTGTRIVLGHYQKTLRLRKYDAFGSSFKLIVCHEVGHALGVNDSYDKRTIMNYNAGTTEAADNILDWDSRNAVRWLYYQPYPSTTQSPTTSVGPQSTGGYTRPTTDYEGKVTDSETLKTSTAFSSAPSVTGNMIEILVPCVITFLLKQSQ